MKYNPENRTYTLTNGKILTEKEVARFHSDKLFPLKHAARVIDAETQGWKNINYNFEGTLIGLPPTAKSPMEFEPIP